MPCHLDAYLIGTCQSNGVDAKRILRYLLNLISVYLFFFVAGKRSSPALRLVLIQYILPAHFFDCMSTIFLAGLYSVKIRSFKYNHIVSADIFKSVLCHFGHSLAEHDSLVVYYQS